MASPKKLAYVPILKWKRGEQQAVSSLPVQARQRVLPLVEVQDRPFDWAGDEYTRDWREHLDLVIEATAKYWAQGQEIAVDQPLEVADSIGGRPAWNYLFTRMWDKGIAAVPVVSSLAGDIEVHALSRLMQRRCMLRFCFDQEEHGGSPLSAGRWIRSVFKQLKTEHEQVDVVMDVGHVFEKGIPADFCANALSEIALQGPWRSLTFASGSFPANLAGLPRGVHQVPRRDWALFGKVEKFLSGSGLCYGDYGVSHTDVFDADPRTMRMSANLRYTHFEHWLVYKARSVKEHGFGQYRDLCELLVHSPDYMGSQFSDGDKSYQLMAAGLAKGPGNATTWRRDATNHHIHMVLHQMS